MTHTMRAIVQDAYGSPEVLVLREIDRPVVGEGDVLVRVRAAAVHLGAWHVMAGLPYLVRIMGYGIRAPHARVRGMDVAGVIEEVGKDVRQLRPGDEVFGTCAGAFAEYASAREDRLVLKPARLAFEQAAAVPTSACAALNGLRDTGHVRPGHEVLVIGAAGGVGTFAVQLATAFGARVTGVCSTAKMDLVRSLGADEVIDYTREDLLSGGRRYDLILDTAGNRPLRQLRRLLTRKGTLVIVGAEGGGRWFGHLDRQIRAVLLSPFVSQRLRGLVSAERTKDLQFLGGLIDAGTLTPVIDRTYPLGEAPDAIRYLAMGHARGKVVVTV